MAQLLGYLRHLVLMQLTQFSRVNHVAIVITRHLLGNAKWVAVRLVSIVLATEDQEGTTNVLVNAQVLWVLVAICWCVTRLYCRQSTFKRVSLPVMSVPGAQNTLRSLEYSLRASLID